MVVPVFLIVAVAYVYFVKHQQSAVKDFAKQRNLQFQKMVVLNGLDGVIFRNSGVIQATGVSSGSMANWLISGVESNISFRMFEHRLSLGRNESSNFTVMDIAVNGNGLRFLLASKTHPSTINNVNSGLQKLSLEGNFDSFFTLYGSAGSEVETLQIFTPDIMALLIDHYQDYAIELTPMHLFLYKQNPNMLKSVSSIDQMLNDALGLTTKFFPVVTKVDTSTV
jgi:hypothetical protein